MRCPDHISNWPWYYYLLNVILVPIYVKLFWFPYLNTSHRMVFSVLSCFVQPKIHQKSHYFLFLFSFSTFDNIRIQLNFPFSFQFVLILNRVTRGMPYILHYNLGRIYNFLGILCNNFWKYHPMWGILIWESK